MTQQEYNAFVQGAQEFAISAGLQHRIEATTSDEGDLYSSAQIHWGTWQEIAAEWRAMTPRCHRITRPYDLARIQYEVAGEVSK